MQHYSPPRQSGQISGGTLIAAAVIMSLTMGSLVTLALGWAICISGQRLILGWTAFDPVVTYNVKYLNGQT